MSCEEYKNYLRPIIEAFDLTLHNRILNIT